MSWGSKTRGVVLLDISMVWSAGLNNHTVHGFYVLMENVPAVAEFKCRSDLITNLNDLAFREALAFGTIRFFDRARMLDC